VPAPLVETPFDSLDPSIPGWSYRGEQGWTHINICVGTSLACVYNRSLGGRAGGWVEDRDCLAAEWVDVRVCSVVHHRDGEGHDSIGVVVCDSAGANTSRIICNITSILQVCMGVQGYGNGNNRERKDEGSRGDLHGRYGRMIAEWGGLGWYVLST